VASGRRGVAAACVPAMSASATRELAASRRIRTG
jgi:hypothetical protein